MKKKFLGIIPAVDLKVLIKLSFLDLMAEDLAGVLVYMCVFANW
jgi:hypothetical protein